jgi:threonine synthase
VTEPLQYVSTRGQAPELDFGQALVTGLASDGGLYCPVTVPELPELPPLGAPYHEVARAVTWPYVAGSVEADSYGEMVSDAYRSFRDPDVAPVRDLGGNIWLTDLSKGPTLAFKDFALQLVGRLLDHQLAKENKHVTVIGATSGDTGSAAIEALANRERINVVILHPEGRVSEVQRKQMTTVLAANVRNVAVDGTFDDCQDLVKAAFADEQIRSEFSLAAVNSINWGRVMAQIVYYVTSWRAVAPDGGPVSFAVPTGNFGNILAAWYAKRMGVPIRQLVVASNRNDVLTKFFETGRLTANEVVASLSPSMDIQVSSNFERLLWEASGRDGEAVTNLLGEFRATGDVAVPQAWVDTIRTEFVGVRLDDDGTLDQIRRIHQELGLVIDPHTAVGVFGAKKFADGEVPMVVMETADPAKFPDAVEAAIGIRPELPSFLSELLGRQEYLEKSAADLSSVAEHLAAVQRS